ncbi:MAG: biotin/lipoyl-containing protein [Fimbriimonadaceae bacterium]
MKKLVNGIETDLPSAAEGTQITRLADRLAVRTANGTATAAAIQDGDATLVSYRGRQYRIEKPGRAKGPGAIASGKLVAPMPGLVVDVMLAQGEPVKKGDRILVLEAMKVQQSYVAPFDGVLASLAVKKGDQVQEGSMLALVEPVP